MGLAVPTLPVRPGGATGVSGVVVGGAMLPYLLDAATDLASATAINC